MTTPLHKFMMQLLLTKTKNMNDYSLIECNKESSLVKENRAALSATNDNDRCIILERKNTRSSISIVHDNWKTLPEISSRSFHQYNDDVIKERQGRPQFRRSDGFIPNKRHDDIMRMTLSRWESFPPAVAMGNNSNTKNTSTKTRRNKIRKQTSRLLTPLSSNNNIPIVPQRRGSMESKSDIDNNVLPVTGVQNCISKSSQKEKEKEYREIFILDWSEKTTSLGCRCSSSSKQSIKRSSDEKIKKTTKKDDGLIIGGTIPTKPIRQLSFTKKQTGEQQQKKDLLEPFLAAKFQ